MIALLLVPLLLWRCVHGGQHCVFIHGLGFNGSFRVVDRPPRRYWGPIDHYVRHNCDTQAYTEGDTIHFAWSAPELHELVCEAMRPPSPSDTVIAVTHSMGNLILAAALQSERCTLGDRDTWVTIGAPWRGIPAAMMARLRTLCQYVQHRLCHQGALSASLRSLSASTPGLPRLVDVATRYARLGLCGTSAWGEDFWGSWHTWQLVLLGWYLRVPWLSDGLVSLEDCVLGGGGMMLLPVNHADLSAKNPSHMMALWYHWVTAWAAANTHAGATCTSQISLYATSWDHVNSVIGCIIPTPEQKK